VIFLVDAKSISLPVRLPATSYDQLLVCFFDLLTDMKVGSETKMETIRSFGQDKETVRVDKICIDRGMSWDSAYSRYTLCRKAAEGFYVSRFAGKSLVVLAIEESNNSFGIYRPSTGRSFATENIFQVRKRENISHTQAKGLWDCHYLQSGEICHHKFL